MIQDVMGFPLALERPQPFDFLRKYGRVFSLEARPQQGVVYAGVEGGEWGRLLIKFAGAALSGMRGEPAQAARTLQAAMPLYQALYAHPALVKLQGHGAVAGGYAAVYRWAAGECLQPDARAQEEARRTGRRPPMERLRRQPLLTRLRMLDRVMDFHVYAAAKGVVPVGFYDGSLLADFETGDITVRDIDLYRATPAWNDCGRMPGSARFLSPEEYEYGAPLDEISAQYALGALAFAFLSEGGERGAWSAGEGLWRVAKRAVSERREERYPSLAAFLQAWRQEAGRATGENTY